MSPKDTEVIASMSTTEVPVEVAEEPVITYQKFGEMELPEDEEADDGDYVPSDADSEDSLEWSSETERTMAEDALAEGTVGLDFFNAAYSVATEYVASYTPVQMGLSVATVVPVASIQRAARAARRAGAKNIEVVERWVNCDAIEPIIIFAAAPSPRWWCPSSTLSSTWLGFTLPLLWRTPPSR